jgi:hypothetical protein
MLKTTRAEILAYWDTWLQLHVIDTGEPTCWACGEFWWGRYDPPNKATPQQILRAWNRAPLQRCHIVASSLGGSDDPSNLFLMCRDCHDRSPNTCSREAFLTWAASQSFLRRFRKQVEEEMATFGIHDEEVPELVALIRLDEFLDWSLSNAAQHFPQTGSGRKFSVSTMFAAALEFRKARKLASGEAVQSTLL